MSPKGWGPQKSIYDNDCEKLFKTKKLAKYITNSTLLIEALTRLSSLDKRVQLIEKAFECLDSQIFRDSEEQSTHALNHCLMTQLQQIIASGHEQAKNQLAILLKIVDVRYLCEHLELLSLKGLLQASFRETFFNALSDEATSSALCQRILSELDGDATLADELFLPEGSLHAMLLMQLQHSELPAQQKAKLFIALLRNKKGHSFFCQHKKILFKHLNAELVSYVNSYNESALLYLIAEYWMFLLLSSKNLFEELDAKVVHAISDTGPHQGQSIAMRLTSTSCKLALSLVLMHEAKILSLLTRDEIKSIFLSSISHDDMISSMATAMKSMVAFKRIEQSLFQTRQMDLLQKDEIQEAIAKLYLQMEQSDVVLSKEDRRCLMQYMGRVALNYIDNRKQTVVQYLLKYTEGIERLKEDSAFSESVSDTTLHALDEESRELFLAVREQQDGIRLA